MGCFYFSEIHRVNDFYKNPIGRLPLRSLRRCVKISHSKQRGTFFEILGFGIFLDLGF
jgi:hypothetical protein